MTPRGRPNITTKTHSRPLGWPPRQKKIKMPTLGERIKKAYDNFQKRRIERMPPEMRQDYLRFKAAENRYSNNLRNIKEIKKLLKKEEKGWARERKKKGTEFSEADQEQESTKRKLWTDRLSLYEEALPRLKEDYETARLLWIGARKYFK